MQQQNMDSGRPLVRWQAPAWASTLETGKGKIAGKCPVLVSKAVDAGGGAEWWVERLLGGKYVTYMRVGTDPVDAVTTKEADTGETRKEGDRAAASERVGVGKTQDTEDVRDKKERLEIKELKVKVLSHMGMTMHLRAHIILTT
ncbi:hypothetical protein NDU88_001544 [Pleurodeles waltl]|uniref:Uncharacterized protein n=1 Tax=Pleurodeles waltl TaxID=8319 RepID=A0AAV7TI46_PLEWA|nr:hypothetical protein NDU88_001544 [Pleurodeles waltl]